MSLGNAHQCVADCCSSRRLSIGCVLVTLPSVLILDEPTSGLGQYIHRLGFRFETDGLDAFTSYLLLLTLSQLARRGRTIILSIHAPRSDAFDIFDRIALLSKGQIVYSGLRRDCLAWFADLSHHVEKGVNPLGKRPLVRCITALTLGRLFDRRVNGG